MPGFRAMWAARARRARPIAVVIVALASATGVAAESEVDAERESYSLGHQIGMDLLRQSRELDFDAVERGLADGLEGRPPAYDDEELQAMLLELKRGIVAQEREDRIRGRGSLRRAGEAFMVEHAQRPGVVTHTSGIQYRVLREGSGPTPGADDRVEVRYRSTRLDGTAFHDSMREGGAPETLRVSSLIPGLQEVLPLMPVGARWEIVLPPDLAFRRRGPLADHTVIYDLELLAIAPEAASNEEGAR